MLYKIVCGQVRRTARSHTARHLRRERFPFNQLRHLLRRLGFDERIRGDHYIFTKRGVEEIFNLQPKGHQAKAYQVKQVRAVLVKYGLAGGHNEK